MKAVDATSGAAEVCNPTAVELTALYRSEFPYVWNVLFRLGVSGPEREDLAQETFAAAFKQWAQFDRSRPIKPWLFGISYRLVRDFRRKRQNQLEQEVRLMQWPEMHDSPEEATARRQGLKFVERVLRAMEFDRRAVFVMHEIDGYPIPQVAETLGIPLNTAYSRLRLARKEFNEFVERARRREGVATP